MPRFPSSLLFPYTTLFRSPGPFLRVVAQGVAQGLQCPYPGLLDGSLTAVHARLLPVVPPGRGGLPVEAGERLAGHEGVAEVAVMLTQFVGEQGFHQVVFPRSEERRVGKECRSRGAGGAVR